MRISRAIGIKWLAAVLVAVSVIGSMQAGANESAQRQVVVVGSPKNVKFIASATHMLPDGNVRVANEYAVSLQQITKIAGDGEVPKRLNLKMFATHAKNLSGEDLIMVVLGVEEGSFYVKYWDVIRQTTCMPRELYQNERLPDGYYANVVDDMICIKFR